MSGKGGEWRRRLLSQGGRPAWFAAWWERCRGLRQQGGSCGDVPELTLSVYCGRVGSVR